MDFIDYCIYTKNFNALTAANDYIQGVPTLLRDDDKLNKKQKKRKMKLMEKLSIASSLATLGYVGMRTGNYLDKKYWHKTKVDPDENLTDVQDEDQVEYEDDDQDDGE